MMSFTRLADLHDVFSRLNDLNLGLQLFNVRDKTEAMIKKLEPFSVCINKDDTQVFPSLHDFLRLIEFVTSGSVKIEFNQKPLPDFWIGLRSEYPALVKRCC